MASPEIPSIESTEEVCAGCGKKLNLLENYLKITAKAERQVVVEQPLSEWEAVVGGVERTGAEILAATESDEEEETVRYLGSRSGAGEAVKVHNGDCAQAYFEKNWEAEEAPKITFFRAGEEDYESVGRSSE